MCRKMYAIMVLVAGLAAFGCGDSDETEADRVGVGVE